MKATVTDACTGCGLCVDTAPDVFEMAGDIAKVKVNPLPDNLVASAKEAADGCPTTAIVVE